MAMKPWEALWDYAHPDETEKNFRVRLGAVEASGDPDDHAQMLTQIARAQGLQQRFDDAHATLDRVRALLIEHGDDPDAQGGEATLRPGLRTARVRYLLERGRAFNSSGMRERAAPLFLEAWNAARSLGEEFHAVDAAHMMEIVAHGDDKLRWNANAVAFAETCGDPRAYRWLGALYNNRGWTLHELGRLDEALVAFERRLAWLQSNPPDDSSRQQGHETDIGIAHWSIAKMFRLLGRVEEALAIQRRLLEARGGEADGYVHEELAECLLVLDLGAEARPHFARAHALLAGDPWLRRNESARLERLERLGQEGP